MGKEKYQRDIGALFEKSPVVNYSSISRIIKSKKNAGQYTKRVLNYLVSKGKIKQLTRGYYTKHNDNLLVVFCFQPAYLGLQDALSFHNLWEQETIPIIITTKRARQGIRKILGGNVLIRRIDKKYFFGIGHYQYGKVAMPYSDIEKTFIDMAYFKENLNEEAILEFKKNINMKRLKSYLNKYPKNFRNRVILLLGGKRER